MTCGSLTPEAVPSAPPCRSVTLRTCTGFLHWVL